jgi:prevent-host-death family protein
LLVIGGTHSATGHAGPVVRVSARQRLLHGVTVSGTAYPLNAAQTHLGELVTEARHSHRPITISEDGKLVAALIDIDDLADLEGRAALAAHLADKVAGRRYLITITASNHIGRAAAKALTIWIR